MTGVFPPRVIGHRGAAASAPENTRAGFRTAARLGISCVEFDVQLSADGVPVVFHDDTLDRTTDGHGPVASTTLATLSGLDAGSWFLPEFAGERIPTLAEILVELGELGLDANIEIKADEARGAETALKALEVIGALWPDTKSPPLLSSFAQSALAEAARLRSDWPRGLLIDRVSDDCFAVARELGCISLHTNARRLDRPTVSKVKKRRFILCAYTVNSPVRAAQLFKWGVDAVFSDRPERIKAPLAKI